MITHKLPLTEAPYGFEVFDKKHYDCIKVI